MSFATVVASSILGKLLASLSPMEIMPSLGGLLRVVSAKQPRPSMQKPKQPRLSMQKPSPVCSETGQQSPIFFSAAAMGFCSDSNVHKAGGA